MFRLLERAMGIESTSDRMGTSTVSLKVSAEFWAQLGRKTPPLRHEIRECRRVRPTDSTGLMVGAVGIESPNACTVNDLQGRPRIEKEGLGSPWNPYCRLKAAFFPMMLRTTLRFASRTAPLS